MLVYNTCGFPWLLLIRSCGFETTASSLWASKLFFHFFQKENLGLLFFCIGFRVDFMFSPNTSSFFHGTYCVSRPLPSNISSYKVTSHDIACWWHIIWILETWFSQIPKHVKGSSDDFIDANVQLALAVVRKLKERKETRVCIVRRIFLVI